MSNEKRICQAFTFDWEGAGYPTKSYCTEEEQKDCEHCLNGGTWDDCPDGKLSRFNKQENPTSSPQESGVITADSVVQHNRDRLDKAFHALDEVFHDLYWASLNAVKELSGKTTTCEDFRRSTFGRLSYQLRVWLNTSGFARDPALSKEILEVIKKYAEKY